MDTLRAPSGIDRGALIERYNRNRRRSLGLFDLVLPQAYQGRSIPLRHPPVFYEGHLPGFSFLKLVKEALGRPSIDAALEKLFERGIDPADAAAAVAHERSAWPSREQTQAFGRSCDAAVIDALANAAIDVPSDPLLERAHSAWTILEHEEMHHETFAYIVHRIGYGDKKPPAGYRTPADGAAPAQRTVTIPAGVATLGARRDEIPFGWDNEFERAQEAVGAFECDVYPVTNGDWLAFVCDGGPVPPFWIAGDGEPRLLAAWEPLPLPLAWPVWVSNDQARAYASWRGRSVMTEAEYHRAAYGTPAEGERAFPWGDATPSPEHGNFDWQRWDPEPVGSRPAGVSAWGIHELAGNGWEHTSTPFAPLPGFRPHPSYLPYSADFFDGRHYVVKGASPVTAREHLRRSFRNWYYADYTYLYGKFRTVSR